MTTGNEFLNAVRGIPTHDVAMTLNEFTFGTRWGGCSKKYMANEFDKATHKALQRIEMAHLAVMARARADGFDRWWDLPRATKHLVDKAARNGVNIDPVHTALGVLVLTPHIRKYLAENDPMALEQAETAFANSK
jgi:hypothetical protein